MPIHLQKPTDYLSKNRLLLNFEQTALKCANAILPSACSNHFLVLSTYQAMTVPIWGTTTAKAKRTALPGQNAALSHCASTSRSITPVSEMRLHPHAIQRDEYSQTNQKKKGDE